MQERGDQHKSQWQPSSQPRLVTTLVNVGTAAACQTLKLDTRLHTLNYLNVTYVIRVLSEAQRTASWASSRCCMPGLVLMRKPRPIWSTYLRRDRGWTGSASRRVPGHVARVNYVSQGWSTDHRLGW